ncbi:MAG: glycosyltransferase [Spirochaetia bacterium]|nr:glycosyltransferase [Spirochaetia bacterium]
MSDSPLISVLLPVYKAEAWLEECLSSIQKQTEKNFEVLAANDGSTDHSAEILDRFAASDPRFKISHLKYAGIIPTLTEAETRARGKYICRMDADDRMPPRRLEIQSRFLAKVSGPTVVSGAVSYFSDGELGEGFQKYAMWMNALHSHEDHLRELFVECVLPSPGWMMRTEDFRKIGGYLETVYPEDYCLVFKMFAAGMRVVKSDEIVLEWRDHSGRSSRTLDVYRDQKFWPLKAEYLKVIHGTRIGDRELVIWGMGKTAKSMLEAFRKSGVLIHSLVTDNANKIGMRYEGLPVHSPDSLDPKKYYVLVAVSARGARQEIAAKLSKMGFEETLDYCRMV